MAERPAWLVGTWHLVRWEIVAPDGSVMDAFGETPVGRLLYTAAGQMAVVIGRTGRQPLAPNPVDRTSADRAAAFDGVHAYAGRWSLEGDVVVHHVEVSSTPNYEGTEQRRRFHRAGDLLTLMTPPGNAAHLAPGSGQFGRLTWRKAVD